MHFLLFYPSFVSAQLIISDLQGKFVFNDNVNTKLKKYDTLPMTIKEQTIEIGVDSSITLVSKDKLRIKIDSNSKLQILNNNYSLLKGTVTIHNNKEWEYWPVSTFFGQIKLHKNSKATITVDSKAFYLKIQLHDGLLVLPDTTRLIGPKTYIYQLPVVAENSRKGFYLYKSIGLKASTSTYEYFLFENRPSAYTQGLFYRFFLQPEYGIHFDTIHQTILSLNAKVYVQNQFDQKSPIKKNMAYQYIQGQISFYKELELLGYWNSIHFPISYQTQWRSIHGDPSAIYLTFLKVQPTWQMSLNSTHRFEVAPLWQQTNFMNIKGGHIQYLYYWDEEIQYPIRLEMYQKKGPIIELAMGRKNNDFYLGLGAFDYTKSSSGKGARAYFEYYYYKLTLNLTFTYQINSFRDLALSLDYLF